MGQSEYPSVPPEWHSGDIRLSRLGRWLWLPLYGSAVFGLLSWRLELRVPPPPEAVARVNLASYDSPEYGPAHGLAPGPPGGRNRKGNDAIDALPPAIPDLDVVEASPARAFPIFDLRPSVPPLTVGKGLAVQFGSAGVLPGGGAGFGRGRGDGVGDGTGEGGAGILKLIKSAAPNYSSDPALAPMDGQRVMVRLQVGKDGVPFEALVVSSTGHEPSFPAILKAALAWRFLVPHGFASRAPFKVFVNFSYRHEAARTMRPERISQVSEIAPVVLQ